MGIKLDKTAIIVCSVVGSLGVLSAIFGFSAEGTKLTPYTILVFGDECIYPQNPALGLGICAAIFLLVAQVVISAVGGCCGCCKSRSIPSETKRIVGIVCAVFSWIAAVIAWALLIEGASWNTNVVRMDGPYCSYLKDGIFAGGGVLTLAATALGIASFILLRSPPAAAAETTTAAAPAAAAGTPNTTPGMSPQSEFVMGHPLLPTGKPQDHYPAKPHGYGGHPITESHPQPQGHGQAQQNLQYPPPPAPAPAAQENGSHHTHNQQQLPAAAPVMPMAVCAPLASSGQAPPLVGVPIGGQPQVSLPQVHMPPATTMAIPSPLQGGLEMPVNFAPTAPPAGSGSSGLSTVIRNEVARQGIKFAAEMVRHSLLSDNNATDSDSTGVVDAQATNY